MRHRATTHRSRPATQPAIVRTAPTRFQYLANEVCSQARGSGIPVGLPSDPNALRAYASAALPSTVNLAVGLERLAADNGRTSTVAPFLAQLHTLARLYRQAASGASGSVAVRSISTAQHLAARSARQIGLGLCAQVAGARA